MTEPGGDLNGRVHLERLVAYRADGSVSGVVVAGRLSPDGVFGWAGQPGPGPLVWLARALAAGPG